MANGPQHIQIVASLPAGLAVAASEPVWTTVEWSLDTDGFWPGNLLAPRPVSSLGAVPAPGAVPPGEFAFMLASTFLRR